jgi:hypothetical protein
MDDPSLIDVETLGGAFAACVQAPPSRDMFSSLPMTVS